MQLNVELMPKIQVKIFNLHQEQLVCAINHQVLELELMDQFTKDIKSHHIMTA